MMGMSVSYDPFDENRKLVISQEKVLITFKTEVTTVYFDSRVPMQREITECTHIIRTGEMEWDPRLICLASVWTQEWWEIHKICEIAQAQKVCELKTDRIMGGIEDVSVERSMIERVVASINIS